MIWDVIVVGAGPSGSSAALQLAKYGFKVMLIERNEMPREKSCSGILIKRSMELVRQYTGKNTPASAVCQPRDNRGMILFDDAGKEHRFEQEGLNIWRDKFDYWLALEAERMGALLVYGMVASCNNTDDGVAVELVDQQCTRSVQHARAVIVCDGAAGTLRQKILGAPKEKIVTYQTFHKGEINLDPHYFYAFLQRELSSYDAWFNVKDDYLIVGVASPSQDDIPAFHAKFFHFLMERHGAVLQPQSKAEWWLMPKINPDCQLGLYSGRILFAGEAAGLLNPMGEGISCGMESGHIAAVAIQQAAVEKGLFDPDQMADGYRTGMEPLHSYMRRQWRFTGNLSEAFSHMANDHGTGKK